MALPCVDRRADRSFGRRHWAAAIAGVALLCAAAQQPSTTCAQELGFLGAPGVGGTFGSSGVQPPVAVSPSPLSEDQAAPGAAGDDEVPLQPLRPGQRIRPLGWGFGLALSAAVSPLWVPTVILQDDFDEPGYFPRFPYDRVPGYMMVGPHPVESEAFGLTDLVPWGGSETEEAEASSDAIVLRGWEPEPRSSALRWDLEYADSFEGLNRSGTRLLYSTAARTAVAAQWFYFDDRRSGAPRNSFQLGNVNFLIRFAQSQRAEFRTGVGLNWLSDNRGSAYGVNVHYAADFFIAPPWIISASGDWGKLGQDDLIRGRATLGAIWQRYEFYAGYEYLALGRQSGHYALGGLRMWW